MKNKLITKMGNKIGKISAGAKKHSPELYVAAGIVGVVGSTILACVATVKAVDKVNTAKDKLDELKEITVESEDEAEVIPVDVKKETTMVYAKLGLDAIKLYAPAVILGSLSIASIVRSNNILKKRYLGVSAAYAALDTTFNEYRGRVRERVGEEVEEDIFYNRSDEKIDVVETDAQGKETKKKEKVKVQDPNLPKSTMRYFDGNTSVYYQENDPLHNESFVRGIETFCNQQLVHGKTLTLNEVYRQLGMEQTQEGLVLGWVYDDDPDNDERGDNMVDFGIDYVYIKKEDGTLEKKMVLDFNYDGNIYDRI